MLLPSGLSAFSYRNDNWQSNPSATPGTGVIPGISNAEGSWTALFGGIAQDVYFIAVQVFGGATTGNDKSHLMDIGVDPAGGIAYVAVISNVVIGASTGIAAATAGCISFSFPLFIKAGSSIAVRIQGSNSAAGTVRVCMTLRGQPAAAHMLPLGMFSETIGAITNSGGVSFTPGDAADGTWVSLGTTSKAMWWWQLAFQVSSNAMTAEYCYIELAHGDETNKHLMIRLMKASNSTEAIGVPLLGNMDYPSCYWPLPAGTELWVRGRADSAPDSGYNAVAIGIGG